MWEVLGFLYSAGLNVGGGGFSVTMLWGLGLSAHSVTSYITDRKEGPNLLELMSKDISLSSAAHSLSDLTGLSIFLFLPPSLYLSYLIYLLSVYLSLSLSTLH